jgi:hypothetical protein
MNVYFFTRTKRIVTEDDEMSRKPQRIGVEELKAEGSKLKGVMVVVSGILFVG